MVGRRDVTDVRGADAPRDEQHADDRECHRRGAPDRDGHAGAERPAGHCEQRQHRRRPDGECRHEHERLAKVPETRRGRERGVEQAAGQQSVQRPEHERALHAVRAHPRADAPKGTSDDGRDAERSEPHRDHPRGGQGLQQQRHAGDDGQRASEAESRHRAARESREGTQPEVGDRPAAVVERGMQGQRHPRRLRRAADTRGLRIGQQHQRAAHRGTVAAAGDSEGEPGEQCGGHGSRTSRSA